MKHKQMKYRGAKAERVYTDPVCGMQVNYKTAVAVLEYGNNVYCFCSGMCREKFEKDPESFLAQGKRNKKS